MSTTLRGTRRASSGVRGALALIAATAIVTSCGSDSGVTARTSDTNEATTTSTPVTAAPSTAVVPVTAAPATTTTASGPSTTRPATTSTVATSTSPPVTSPPVTTSPVTTAGPTTSSAPSGWRDAVFPPGAMPALDYSNWSGTPSPALPDSGAALADGIYEASVSTPWTSADPGRLEIVVHRLELCSQLPSDGCLSDDVPSFEPDEVGTDESRSLPISISLDGSVDAAVLGQDCDTTTIRVATGSSLAALFTAFDSAYQATVRPALDAGQESYDVLRTLIDHPTNGFSGEGGSCAGGEGFSAVFHAGDAPPLLLQTVTAFTDDGERPMTPTDLVGLKSVQVKGGRMTLYFYAGFYS